MIQQYNQKRSFQNIERKLYERLGGEFTQTNHHLDENETTIRW